MRRKKGQSVLEYVIVLTAVVAAIAFAVTTFFKPSLERGFGSARSAMSSATDELP